MKLQGKSIVVTGAASGMGKEMTSRFVKEGANVIAVDKREDRLAELVESIKGEADNVITFVGDISKREICDGMIDLAVEKFGKLDVLVNNAGVLDDMSTVAEFTDERYDFVMGINTSGPLYSMRKAINVFLEQGNGGNIITTTSMGAAHQAAGVVYCVSKAALTAAVRHTAFVYRNEDIRCNAISPGGINSDIATTIGVVNRDGHTRISDLTKLMPRKGEPSDVASLAVFLASDDSSFINGQIISVDGGWSAL